ncbi:hypothetical protein Dtox_4063 [Desulfofarcimen acetoxidans DSM 771]|uniref:Uncharacterized protein n=1 Tax=Desulfofarcimen acetoxidans (strain ATCC 49208 / DSM 771 / KCTC 5769 / VKM B-1644 / 5575) TaxID=485916 RepID=C8VYJ3_DESAS|nr:hypothetical protein [Desulfofarcimen acetoxidans]ACV64714.1 hypothetical protein Dtox_4031 [Desulfofarcimen acetoxidans DSM 771]ACV64723.1 hypothetical protein Dtox_4043 [Desulfofarcimen acetoxidans DSM 771]ACV64740.1 hypothetical protein Dtox_4063 [Desulfofarcimen acetoxidans DSM 771]
MATVKIVYGVKDIKKKISKYLSPLEKIKMKKEKAALKELTGLWEDKDTSFFDKR